MKVSVLVCECGCGCPPIEYPWEPEWQAGDCVMGELGIKLRSLEEQQVLLTTEPSGQPLTLHLLCKYKGCSLKEMRWSKDGDGEHALPRVKTCETMVTEAAGSWHKGWLTEHTLSSEVSLHIYDHLKTIFCLIATRHEGVHALLTFARRVDSPSVSKSAFKCKIQPSWRNVKKHCLKKLEIVCFWYSNKLSFLTIKKTILCVGIFSACMSEPCARPDSWAEEGID